jgi:hypothetical protein
MYKVVYTASLPIGLLFTQSAFGQDSKILTKDKDETYSFEKIYELPGKAKADIFAAIKSWVIKNVKTQSNTNYFDDADKSTISTTPAFVVSKLSSVEFKLNTDIKDGKYKLSATGFVLTNPQGIPKKLGDYSGLYAPKGARKKIMDDVDENFSKIIASIEEATKGKSDW